MWPCRMTDHFLGSSCSSCAFPVTSDHFPWSSCSPCAFPATSSLSLTHDGCEIEFLWWLWELKPCKKKNVHCLIYLTCLLAWLLSGGVHLAGLHFALPPSFLELWKDVYDLTFKNQNRWFHTISDSIFCRHFSTSSSLPSNKTRFRWVFVVGMYSSSDPGARSLGSTADIWFIMQLEFTRLHPTSYTTWPYKFRRLNTWEKLFQMFPLLVCLPYLVSVSSFHLK